MKGGIAMPDWGPGAIAVGIVVVAVLLFGVYAWCFYEWGRNTGPNRK